MLQAPESGATVNQWLTYLEALHPTEIDLGLDRVLLVLRRLFPKKPSARIITIGGTNGKGTTVAALERLLLDCGRTVGAYTSPHLLFYNERVRLNGQDVSDEALVSAFEAVEQARRSVSLTYFEYGTLAAFVIFQRAGLTDWLLEVGLGGRLDAVNVLDADLAIITAVDLDHTAWLGDNRELIGYEKAGILRPGQQAVVGELDPPRSILQQVSAQRVHLKRLGVDYRIMAEVGQPRQIVAIDATWRVGLPDSGLPEESLAAAVQAFRLLQPEQPPEAIEKSLGKVQVAGRFEQLGDRPRVILDVGHNPHAARWLSQRIGRLAVKGRVLAVYACLADKDTGGVLSALAPVVDDWFLAALDVPRGLDADTLLARARASLGPEPVLEVAASVAQALDNALATATGDDCILIFGSFFTVAEARAILLSENLS